MPSTVIRKVAYRPERQELEVLFATGRRYLFLQVPEGTARAFAAARIKGIHFNRHIRGRYRFIFCGVEEPEDTNP
ncbi:MAG: KTSC domain-containing protein [Sphingomonadales bacterium]